MQPVISDFHARLNAAIASVLPRHRVAAVPGAFSSCDTARGEAAALRGLDRGEKARSMYVNDSSGFGGWCRPGVQDDVGSAVT